MQSERKRNMKIFFKVAAAAMFIAILASVQAYAGNESLAHSVDLMRDETIKYSNTCEGRHKYIWGNNSPSSDQGVWFVAEVFSNGKWVEDKEARVHLKPGASLEETSTYVYSGSHTWRLKLDPYAWNWGCTAVGYIRNK